MTLVLAGTFVEAPVVVAVMEVVEGGVVTATMRCVVEGGHARIPFAECCSLVTRGGHFCRNASHIAGDRSKARDRVFWVVYSGRQVQRVDVVWVSAALKRGACRRAVLVHLARHTDARLIIRLAV